MSNIVIRPKDRAEGLEYRKDGIQDLGAGPMESMYMGKRVYEGDFLVGDVLICKNSEML